MALPELLYVTTNPGEWGDGEGRPLMADEIDSNFYQLRKYLADQESNPLPPNGIKEVVYNDPFVTFILDDNSEFGPYRLPTSRMRYVGLWGNEMPLFVNDFFTVDEVGVFITLANHTTPPAPTTFDPNAAIEDSIPLYQQVFGPPQILRYTFAFGMQGLVPGNSELMAQHVFNVRSRLVQPLSEARSFLRVPPAEHLTLTMVKNDAQEIGTIEHPAGERFGTFIFGTNVDFDLSDRLSVFGPLDEDEMAEHWSASILARRLD